MAKKKAKAKKPAAPKGAKGSRGQAAKGKKPAAPKKGRAAADGTTTAAYERHRAKMRAASAARSKAGRDIGELPAPVDPKRRQRCRLNLRLFLETYLFATFGLRWSDDHLKLIATIEDVVLRGGQSAFALPRGNGKTSITEGAALWAVLYGHRRYVAIVGSDKEAAIDILESIKIELETNDLLAADFPEVCAPIAALEGIAHRCKGQTHCGQRTHCTWKNTQIVLPTIAGSVASGAIIVVRGITGRIRGMKHKTPAGESIRPDLVILDDPQTDESAASAAQTEKRERIVRGAVLGLAGPAQKRIAAVMPCTVINEDDLADRLTDRERCPEWRGIRAPLMYALPTNLELWEHYADLRRDAQRNDQPPTAANNFYKKNRKKMDAGAKAAWPDRYNEDEISAVQYAMNLRIDNGEAAFLAEYQQQPKRASEQAPIDLLSPDEIAAKQHGFQCGHVPDDATRIVAHVDVQQRVLYFDVLAVADDFTSYVIEHGTWPKQTLKYFELASVRNTIADAVVDGRKLGGLSIEAQMRIALNQLVDGDLMTRTYTRDDGAEMPIKLALVDGGWQGKAGAKIVERFVRESKHAARLLVAFGRGVKAGDRPMSEYKTKRGERLGDEWYIPHVRGKRGRPHVLFDTNHWKTFAHRRWATPIGAPGSLSLYRAAESTHRMFAEHQRAESPTETQGRGRKLIEWRELPNRDNHHGDNLVGALVAASIDGARLPDLLGAKPRKRRPRRKVSYL